MAILNKTNTLTAVKKIHWNCHYHCNMSCDFCYSWFDSRMDLTYEQALSLLNNVKKLFNHKIKFTFGGGDPLLRGDIAALIKYAKRDLNFDVELQTNAVKLDSKKLKELVPYVDNFGFSIDGEDESAHRKMRGVKNNLSHIIQLLDELDNYRKRDLEFDVTIRTLVTLQNYQNLSGILPIVLGHPSITKWSLRQFVPIEKGFQNKSKYYLEEFEFNSVVENLLDLARLKAKDYLNRTPKLKIASISSTDMVNCYCLISPGGEIYYHPENGHEYISLGNILAVNFEKAFFEINDKCVMRQKRDDRSSLLEPSAAEISFSSKF